MSYDFGQLQTLWKNNGGNPGWAPLMAGIALAESSGTPTEAFDTTTSQSARKGNAGHSGATGLWQIEWPLHSDIEKSVSHKTTRTALYTPNINARVAIALFGTGAGASAWKTDKIYDAWAAAGFPQKPSGKTVTKWLVAKGLTNSTFGANTTTPNRPPGTTATTPAPSETTKCALTIDLKVTSICVVNKRQLREIKGGLLVLGGGAVMAVGILMLAAFGLKSASAAQQMKKFRGQQIRTQRSQESREDEAEGARMRQQETEHDQRLRTTRAYRERLSQETAQWKREERLRQRGILPPLEQPFTQADQTPKLRQAHPGSTRRAERRPKAHK
jgi:hypothetical protein